MSKKNRREASDQSGDTAILSAPAAAAEVQPGVVHGVLEDSNESADESFLKGTAEDLAKARDNTGGTPVPLAPVPLDGIRSAMIECPSLLTAGYATRNLRDLPRRHAEILRDVVAGLAHEGAAMQDGRPVRDGSDAVVWLLEQIAKGDN